jgi:hypothetical protein
MTVLNLVDLSLAQVRGATEFETLLRAQHGDNL